MKVPLPLVIFSPGLCISVSGITTSFTVSFLWALIPFPYGISWLMYVSFQSLYLPRPLSGTGLTCEYPHFLLCDLDIEMSGEKALFLLACVCLWLLSVPIVAAAAVTVPVLGDIRLQPLWYFSLLNSNNSRDFPGLHCQNGINGHHQASWTEQLLGSQAFHCAHGLCWTAQPHCVSSHTEFSFITYIHSVLSLV